MKVLSLKQPWAELVLKREKVIETRKWNTKYRGYFLIHASKVPDKAAMREFGYKSLPTGQIIGSARLIDTKKYENLKEFKRDQKFHKANERYFSEKGTYGFILKEIKRVKPVEAKGKLGFWDYNYKF